MIDTSILRWARYHDQPWRWANWELVSDEPNPSDRFTVEISDGKTQHELEYEQLKKDMQNETTRTNH